ncbi:hypothetical protein GXW83_03945 [Streptacidiphilus sp. PB12-B1b]|uniref:hypothetical protein n=1 Tax=Streptacidiphilus sp. PB12-B1b TaxID=2705012 RepID=UPI0015FD6D9D|nr:hypothetical protein [Streptacidiphilus sp. PB12-B1b]QMU75037.1 hypothetical protein GXW83_03945 [Streptacidiphilus sp. PB12-B1b]
MRVTAGQGCHSAALGHQLNLDARDSSGLSLMSVHPETETQPQDAVVWIREGAVQKLFQKIEQSTEDTRGGNPKNNALVANIEQIERATIRSLWLEEARVLRTNACLGDSQIQLHRGPAQQRST